jgi:hypothetical protein
MFARDAALRRLTVCRLTRESRGNGGGLRPRVWLRLRAAAGGNWTPDAPEPEIAMDGPFQAELSMSRSENLGMTGGTRAAQPPRAQFAEPGK